MRAGTTDDAPGDDAPGDDAPGAALGARIAARSARVGIVGMGYVGLPLAHAVVAAGYPVLGLDLDAAKVRALGAGESYIRHVGGDSVAAMRATGRFDATGDFERLAWCDIILICVPTPLGRHRDPDLSFVLDTTAAIARRLRRGQLIVLESTTYPGTTTGLMRPVLEEAGLQRGGLRCGADFFLAYSPEREDPGNPRHGTAGIPKVVGGDGAEALALATAFYASVVTRAVPVSSPAAAEAVKLTENIFRAVNIALVNELKVIYDAMGLDVWEVLDAAATKPFGYMRFDPGPGLGGHCIPVDPFYLTWKAREFGIPTRLVELAGEINVRMPDFVVDRLARALDARTGRGLRGARILILGMAYKPDVDDLRESPSLVLTELLEARGAAVDYHDPHIPEIGRTREHPSLAGRRSVPLDEVASYDAVLIATDHAAVDHAAVIRAARLVVDTRNAAARAGITDAKVVKA